MRSVARVGVVAGGYVAAVAIASAVVAIRVVATSGPDRQTYAAMYDFGDGLLFLGVFGIAALPATGAALFFLRPYRAFWLTMSAAALIVAAAGVAAFAGYVAPTVFAASSSLRAWMALASLDIFVAPLFAIFFGLSAMFAPVRFARISFLVAAAVELSLSVYVGFVWFGPFHR